VEFRFKLLHPLNDFHVITKRALKLFWPVDSASMRFHNGLACQQSVAAVEIMPACVHFIEHNVFHTFIAVPNFKASQ
jgi:hypothetical protein